MSPSPTIGFMVGALIAMAFTWLSAYVVFRLLSPEGRDRFRRALGPRAPRTSLIGGSIAGLVSLAGVLGNPPRSAPLWQYALFWFVGVFVPVVVALWLYRRWAIRKGSANWDQVVSGKVGYDEMDPALRRGMLVALTLAVIPGAILGIIWFDLG